MRLQCKLVLGYLAISFIWGSAFVGIRVLLGEMPPFFLLAVRSFLGALFLIFLLRPIGFSWLPVKFWHVPFFSGLLLVVVAQGALTLALRDLPGGVVSTVVMLIPLMTFLWTSFFFTKEKISLWGGLGLGAGFLGILLLFWGQVQWKNQVRLHALALAMLCPLAASYIVLWVKPRVAKVGIYRLSVYQFLFGSLCLFLISFFMESWQGIHLSRQGWFWLLYISLVCTSLVYLIYFWLLKKVNATLLSTHTYLMTLFATLLGHWLLKETYSALELLAMGVIIAGLATTTLTSAKFFRSR